MTYFRGMGDDAPPAPPAEGDSDIIRRIDQRTQKILDQQADEARSRRLAVYVGVAGALFAAVKMGIIAMPHFRKVHKVPHSTGVLTPLAANPRRDRRRR